jgi:hypothetical protein
MTVSMYMNRWPVIRDCSCYALAILGMLVVIVENQEIIPQMPLSARPQVGLPSGPAQEVKVILGRQRRVLLRLKPHHLGQQP